MPKITSKITSKTIVELFTKRTAKRRFESNNLPRLMTLRSWKKNEAEYEAKYEAAETQKLIKFSRPRPQ
jgi:hypothetical protein